MGPGSGENQDLISAAKSDLRLDGLAARCEEAATPFRHVVTGSLGLRPRWGIAPGIKASLRRGEATASHRAAKPLRSKSNRAGKVRRIPKMRFRIFLTMAIVLLTSLVALGQEAAAKADKKDWI